ncbi:MAG: hypothetical protein K2Q01_00190 [Rickettsiales bacterium]|nr:hypothetical protein [Rickettsiales bacterium]
MLDWARNPHKLFAKLVEDNLDTRGVMVQEHPEVKQLSVAFFGLENDALRERLTEVARRVDSRFTAKVDLGDTRGMGMAVHTLAISGDGYHEVMKLLRPALQERDKKKTKEVPVLRTDDTPVAASGSPDSLMKFPGAVLEELRYFEDGKKLVIRVPHTLTLNDAQRGYLVKLGSVKRSEKGWEFTVEDEALARSIKGGLEARGHPILPYGGAEEKPKDTAPKWIAALKGLKAQDPRSFTMVYPPKDGPQAGKVVYMLVSNEDRREELEAVLREGGVKFHTEAVDAKLKPLLAKLAVPDTADTRQLRVTGEANIALLETYFPRAKGRPGPGGGGGGS